MGGVRDPGVGVEFVRQVGRDRDVRALCEVSPFEVDGGNLIGRDPRTVGVGEFASGGHVVGPLLRVIQAKCLDCCGGSAGEVRKCTATGCPLWPYRLGTNPLRERRVMSEEQRAASILRLAKNRAEKSSRGVAGSGEGEEDGAG